RFSRDWSSDVCSSDLVATWGLLAFWLVTERDLVSDEGDLAIGVRVGPGRRAGLDPQSADRRHRPAHFERPFPERGDASVFTGGRSEERRVREGGSSC